MDLIYEGLYTQEILYMAMYTYSIVAVFTSQQSYTILRMRI